MRSGEYGVVFRLGVGFDISGNTSLSLKFTKPDATTLTKTNPDVTVGGTQITSSVGVFNANEWSSYTFIDGDVDQSGAWTAQLTYVDGSKKLIGDVATFTVDA